MNKILTIIRGGYTMKKRIGSLLLILALCFTLLPTAVMAEERVDAWDGSAAESFAGGTGTEEDPYQIANGTQLAYLAQFVNSDSNNDCAGECFVLTADIDLANHDWTPIGNSFSDALFGGTDYSLFAGNLDGKGHTVSNISIGTESTPLESDVFGPVWCDRWQTQQLESGRCHNLRHRKECFRLCDRFSGVRSLALPVVRLRTVM